MSNKVGRKKGQKATKQKYIIEYHNKKDGEWVELGRYPSLKKASEELKINYGLLSDLNIGRRKIYNDFYRIHNIKNISDNLKIEENNDIDKVVNLNTDIEILKGVNLNPINPNDLLIEEED